MLIDVLQTLSGNCGTGHDSMDVHSLSVWITLSMMMSSVRGIIYHLEA